MKMNKKKIWSAVCLLLICAMLVGVIPATATEVADAADSGEDAATDTVKIVVANTDIPQGTRIRTGMLSVIERPNINIPSNAESDMAQFEGLYASSDIYAGEYMRLSQTDKSAPASINPEVQVKPIGREKSNFVIVTDYIKANTGLPVEYYVSRLIEENPNRVIYFPKGEYVFASPLGTPAVAKQSISIILDDGAVIKADDNWRSRDGMDALICLGESAPANDVRSVGSYYSIRGGTLDCNDVADGVCIESGRESVIRNICIKNAKTAIHVKNGANNVSSDCDFEDITIIGTNKLGSVGIDIVAYDNTFTNIRIYDMLTGVRGKGGGHMKNVYVINTDPENHYVGTVGFSGYQGFISNCYVENCETAFANFRAMWDCTAVWTSEHCKKQIAFKDTALSFLIGCRAEFYDVDGGSRVYFTGTNKAKPCIFGGMVGAVKGNHEEYKNYLDTELVYAE